MMEKSTHQEKIECLKLFASKWTIVRENDNEEIPFPKNRTLHVGSLQDAYHVMKQRGLHLISRESIKTYCASGFPVVNFPRATKGLMEVSSTVNPDYEEGKTTYISNDLWKMRVSSQHDTLRLCWYLAKDAEKGSMEKDETKERDTSQAMSGAVQSNQVLNSMGTQIPGGNVQTDRNQAHLPKKVGASWKAERDIMREALKKSPAYLRGKVNNPQKPGLPKKPEAPLPEHDVGNRRKKEKKYFSFVKRIVEMKRTIRAARRSQSEDPGFSSQGLDESQQVQQCPSF